MEVVPLSAHRMTVRCSLRSAALLVVSLVALSQAGCSLFVMAGKMVFGDPKVPSAFSARTGVDLSKDDKRLLLVCSVPEAVRSDFPSLDVDLVESMTQLLRVRGVELVDADDVADWVDDNGGVWNSPRELAARFDADYIAHVDLEQFTHHEENSPMLYRGRSSGTVFVYEVRRSDAAADAEQVLAQEFRYEYPQGFPVSADRVSAKTFQKRYIDHVSGHLAQMLCDYRLSELVE